MNRVTKCSIATGNCNHS